MGAGQSGPLTGEIIVENLIEIKGITKQYPGVIALDDISVSFQKGEVHALLGENGAGKSTLIKVLSGAIKPDSGSIVCRGKTFPHLTPSLSKELGIGVIYQELNLVPCMSVAENIFLGREMRKGLIADKAQMNKDAQAALDRFQLNILPQTRVSELSVAQQQIVEIIKAITNDVRILIMDEPTAPLTVAEVDRLFELVHSLKSQGVTILYISHRLEELFEIADRVTILRDGRYVDTLEIGNTNEKELIRLMVGRPFNQQYPARNVPIGETVLSVSNLSSHGYLRGISFELKRGEILGIAGLVGAGRTELLRAIYGADKRTSGEVILDGAPVPNDDTARSIQAGLAFIPEDRKAQGLLLDMSVIDNIALSSLRHLSRLIFLKRRSIIEIVDRFIERLRIKTPSRIQHVRNLSGGNQQKVVIGKCLASDARVYLFDEPTRGIDVGAKYEIYSLMNDLVVHGNAVIMVSSDMPEILGMSDRILVMHEGEIAGSLSGASATQESIMELASGTQSRREGDGL